MLDYSCSFTTSLKSPPSHLLPLLKRYNRGLVCSSTQQVWIITLWQKPEPDYRVQGPGWLAKCKTQSIRPIRSILHDQWLMIEGIKINQGSVKTLVKMCQTSKTHFNFKEKHAKPQSKYLSFSINLSFLSISIDQVSFFATNKHCCFTAENVAKCTNELNLFKTTDKKRRTFYAKWFTINCWNQSLSPVTNIQLFYISTK